jgi:hypothetical protein
MRKFLIALFALASVSSAFPAAAQNTAYIASPSFQVVCTGSAQQLPSYQYTTGEILQADTGNSGRIFVGNSTVNQTVGAGGKGFPLTAGQLIAYVYPDTSVLWISCTTAGDVLEVTGS